MCLEFSKIMNLGITKMHGRNKAEVLFHTSLIHYVTYITNHFIQWTSRSFKELIHIKLGL